MPKSPLMSSLARCAVVVLSLSNAFCGSSTTSTSGGTSGGSTTGGSTGGSTGGAAAVSATNSSLTANPAGVAADGSSTTTVTAVIKNSSNSPLSGLEVAFSGPSGVNFSAASGKTDSTGTTSVTATSALAQAATISAVVGGVTLTTQVTFQAGTPSLAQSSFAPVADDVVADGISQMTLALTVNDAQGNAVAGADVTFASSQIADSITVSDTTDASGEAAAVVTTTLAGPRTITATVAGINLTAAVTFVAGPINGITVSANPPVGSANGSPVTISASASDLEGNPVGNQNIAFASSRTADAFSATSALTDPTTGVATVQVYSLQSGDANITASAAGVVGTVFLSFSASSPSSSASVVSINPNSAPADGVTNFAVNATVRDAGSNPVSNQNVVFSFAGSYAGASITPGLVATNAHGVATAHVSGTTAYSTVTVNANVVGYFSLSASGALTAPASAANTSFAGSPNTTVADGVSAITLVVGARSASNAPVVNQSVSFSGAGTFSPNPAVTGSNGNTTVQWTSTEVGSLTATATIGTFTKTFQGAFTAVNPNQVLSKFVTNPNTQAADGQSVINLATTVVDDQNNPISGLTVHYGSTGAATFNPANGNVITNSAGLAAATIASSARGQQTVTAAFGAHSLQQNVTFTGVPSSPNSTFTQSTNTAAANGSAAIVLTATVKDSTGTALAGVLVTFGASGTAHSFSPASVLTSASGSASSNWTTTVAQANVIPSATFGSVVKQGNSTTWTGGAPSNSNITLTAAPVTTVADGSSPATLSLFVGDAYGNPVANQNVVFAVTSGTAYTLSPNVTKTDSLGNANTYVTSTKVQNMVANATLQGIAYVPTVSFAFVPGNPNASRSTFIANPNTGVSDNTTQNALTLTLLDSYGNLVSNANVVFGSSAGNSVTFAPQVTTANSAGVATTNVKSAVSGDTTLFASVLGVTNFTSLTINFLPGAPSQSNSSIVSSPNMAMADRVHNANVTVTVRDNSGNGVPNRTILWTGSPNDYFNPTSAVTDVNGVAVTSYTASKVGNRAVNANVVGSFTLSGGNVTWNNGDPNGALSTAVANPNQNVAGDGTGVVTLTVTARDAYGNPVPNANVLVTSSDSASTTINPNFGVTNSLTGVFSASITSTVAELKTFTATFQNGNSLQATATFVPGNPNGTSSTLVLSPLPGVADGNTQTTATLTVRDRTGNLVTGQSATAAVVGKGTSLTPASGATNSVGVFAPTLVSTFAGNANVSVTVGQSFTLTQNMNFTTPACSSTNPNLVTNQFLAQASYGAQVGPESATVYDFNQDGYKDVAIANYTSGSIGVYTGRGDGTFNPNVIYATAAGPSGISYSDINGDNANDLVIASTAGSFQYFLANVSSGVPTGTFQSGVLVGSIAGAYTANSNDVNGDKLGDVVVGTGTAAATGQVYLHINKGTTSFNPAQVLTIPETAFGGNTSSTISVGSVRFADVNKDGRLDIVAGATVGICTNNIGGAACAPAAGGLTTTAYANGVAVWVNPGANPNFALVTPVLVTATQGVNAQTFFSVGDIDGDGSPDLVVSTNGSTVVNVAYGSGTGTFSTASVLSGAGSSLYYATALRDINGDGALDLLGTANTGVDARVGNKVRPPYGAVTNTYAEAKTAYGIAAGDFNGDGKDDLVVTNSGSANIGILLNSNCH